MAHGSAATGGTNQRRDSHPTDGVSHSGGHRPGRHLPLSPAKAGITIINVILSEANVVSEVEESHL